jgi:hypothetical protein
MIEVTNISTQQIDEINTHVIQNENMKKKMFDASHKMCRFSKNVFGCVHLFLARSLNLKMLLIPLDSNS